MRRTLILLVCILLICGLFGCAQIKAEQKNVSSSETPEEDIISIPQINIDSPDGIVLEVVSADPIYLDRDDSTLLSVKYIIRNNTEEILKGSHYNAIFRGYTTDGKAIFEKDTGMLFYKVSSLDPDTYTEDYFHAGFINGIEQIDRLEIVVELDLY